MRMRSLSVGCSLVIASMAGLTAAPAATAQVSGAATGARAADAAIAAMPLEEALAQLTAQTGLKFAYASNLVAGLRSRAVPAGLAPEEKLKRLLDGTGLKYRYLSADTITLVAGAGSSRDTRPERKQTSARNEDIVGMPAIMVQGARTLNTDITRTRDDPQPYVVFDRDLIERSGAASLEQFLQQRLPMNTSVGSVGIGMGSDVSMGSRIDLRGLGAAQTLILIDGHRMSSPMVLGSASQGDISGIPLASIERIEILPSTASGIYGGSATGGVVNIITRKDYSGGEVRVTYDNTFSSDSATRRLDFVFGHNFNQGRTNLLLSGSYSDANELQHRDRDFIGRGYEYIRSNNPDYFLQPYAQPLGRTPNIVSADGSELVLKSGRGLGSAYTSVPLGYAGTSSDGGAALAGNAGTYNWELPNGPAGMGRSLYSEPTTKGGTLVLRHQFSEGLQAFLDVSHSEARRRYLTGGGATFELAADSPNNPFTTAVLATAAISPNAIHQESLTRRDRVVAGVIKQLPGDWLMSLDYTWDRTRTDNDDGGSVYGFVDAVSWGGLDVDILRDLEAFPVDLGPYLDLGFASSSRTVMKDTNLRISGPLGNLPGGRPVLSAAVAYRDESIPDMVQRSSSDFYRLYPTRSTSVSSAYLEYRVPLFSDANARPGLRELELQIAARRENYVSRTGASVVLGSEVPSPLPEPETRVRSEFSSTDPTIALRWKPVDDLALRMSYGTGFLPPGLMQLVPVFNGPDVLFTADSDPRRGGTNPGQFTAAFRGNPNLHPESSKSWSGGLVFTPSAMPNLRLSVDYTRIEKTDNIAEIPGFLQEVIDNEALFPELVTRGPNLPDDPAGWAGPILHVDWIPLNMARAEIEAWDVQLDYRWETSAFGSFDLFMLGTWQTKHGIQIIQTEPMVDYVGVSGGFSDLGTDTYPLKFKANAGLTWSRSAWRAGWNVSYFDSYRVSLNATTVANQGNGGKVSSQSYHDAFVSYDFSLSEGEVPGWLAGTQVQLGIRNLFDKKPPFDAGGQWGGYFSAFGNPRLASYYLTLVTRF